MQIIPVNEVTPEELLSYFHKLVALDNKRVERPEDVAKITLADEQRWINTLTQRTANQEGVSFCIKSNEGVIGLGEVERKPRWIERHTAEIRFGILPSHRHEGKMLVSALVSDAKKIGITTLYYFHLQSQTQGIEIITESNFNYSGRIRNYYKHGETYVDRVFFERLL
ncbi:N-acetyltransferase family protein [Pseudomonas sp. SDO528_S397]